MSRAFREPPIADRPIVVEIFQNCIVYNDKVFSEFTERDAAREFQIMAAQHDD